MLVVLCKNWLWVNIFCMESCQCKNTGYLMELQNYYTATWKILKLFCPPECLPILARVFYCRAVLWNSLLLNVSEAATMPSFKNLYFNSNGFFVFVFCNLFCFVTVFCCKFLLYFLASVCCLYSYVVCI